MITVCNHIYFIWWCLYVHFAYIQRMEKKLKCLFDFFLNFIRLYYDLLIHSIFLVVTNERKEGQVLGVHRKISQHLKQEPQSSTRLVNGLCAFFVTQTIIKSLVMTWMELCLMSFVTVDL